MKFVGRKADFRPQIYKIYLENIESIEYKEAKDAVDMSVKINVNRLIAQVKAYTADTVDI